MRALDFALIDKSVRCIRMLGVDAVEKANSGHPGAVMGLAGIAFELWTRHLRYDPRDPKWPDRDRFVLSAGHASMLLYGLLHLSGYDVTLDDLKQFRQWGSKTPGHPEVGLTPGVETTTGPLGQGLANAVGMAMGIKMMAARMPLPVATARVFCFAGDGCMMEGITAEASSLAGHLGLDNLVVVYDDNHITIDGATDLAFSEDVAKRYESYGWDVQRIDGHNAQAIRTALDNAVAVGKGKPQIIIARTHIGFGAPNKQDSHKAHGEPLGANEVKGTKEAAGWPLEPTFLVPDEVRAVFEERAKDGAAERARWQERVAELRAKHPDAAALYDRLLRKDVPATLFADLVAASPAKDAATRVQSGILENKVAAMVPSLAGGSADLNPSTKTYIDGSPALKRGEFAGRNIHFGIREHAMGAVMNGMALTEGFIPFGSTFLVFSDYLRPAMRLAALSHIQSLFVFTHDSVYVGEDGPTHQPVEHYWALRVIPNLDVIRPADALECAAAWSHALQRTNGPTAILLTRQTLPNLARAMDFKPEAMLRGGYVLSASKAPEAVLIATGSEVHVAIGAQAALAAKGRQVSVVSMPCYDQFMRQDEAYRTSVLPKGTRRAVVEIGVSDPWKGLVGESGLVIGHDRFGASAPDKVLAKEFGFTVEAVTSRVLSWLG